MANTTNLDLVKPAGTDKALVSVINANSDKIDTFAGSTNQAITTLNSGIATKAFIQKGNIASGSSVTIQITRPAFVVVGRGSVSGTSTTALIDGWSDIVYLSNNSGLTVSCSNDNLTITNNASSYVNYLVFY